jgi:hypothetical protein
VKPSGLVVYHNTFIAEAPARHVVNVHFATTFLANDAPGWHLAWRPRRRIPVDCGGCNLNRDARRQFSGKRRRRVWRETTN